MERPSFPVELAIALLVLGGLVSMGKTNRSQQPATPTLTETRKVEGSSFEQPQKPIPNAPKPTKPAMGEIDIPND